MTVETGTDSIAEVFARREQHPHRKAFHIDGITGSKSHGGALHPDHLIGDGDLLLGIAQFQSEQRRHDLGRAGDERLVLRMERIEDAPCGCVQ